MAFPILTKRHPFVILSYTLFGIFAFVLFVLSALCSIFYFSKEHDNFNLLIMGVSGPGHEGSTLTDTLIFSHISNRGTVLISIPRDIWYQPLQAKVNTFYYYGEKSNRGMGLAKTTIGEMLGQEIDYGLVIDFNLFKEAIDVLGGIDVNVERPLDDYKYPIAGKEQDPCGGDQEYKCRYEHLHFDAGNQHMDGETALKFARSRYANGDEGTDFARAVRQQKVIAAINKKLLSPSVIFNFNKMRALWRIADQIKTDLPKGELVSFAKIFLHKRAFNASSFVLDGWEKGSGLLYHPIDHPSAQWVLLPVDSSWKQIRLAVYCLINQEDKQACIP